MTSYVVLMPNFLDDKMSVSQDFSAIPRRFKLFAPFLLFRSYVRVLKSYRAGVGKSLYAMRRIEQLYLTMGINIDSDDNGGKKAHRNDKRMSIKIPLQEKVIDVDTFCSILLQHTTLPENSFPRIFHIDISHEVS